MKKAIILLHGFLSDQSDFDPIMPDLETRYDYIERFVYPGHHDDESYENFNDEETFFRLEKCFEQLLKNIPLLMSSDIQWGRFGSLLKSKIRFPKTRFIGSG